MEKAGIEDRFF